MIKAAISLTVAVAALAAGPAYGHDGHDHLVSARVSIDHVSKGCHALTLGHRQGPVLSLSLRPGKSVGVANKDGDTFRVVQRRGPQVTTGGRLTTGLMGILMLERPGRYAFDVVRVRKSAFSGKTIGPDNKLRLSVRVL